MKKIRILSVLSVLIICASLFSPALAAEGTDSSPETAAASAMGAILPSYTVKAESALLLELNTGLVLLEQNADEQIYPASLTKIMTCMLTLENGNLSDQIMVSETALSGLDPAGSTAGLQVGEVLSLEELLYCMMLSSANEACNVAAEYVSGSVDAFVELMNQRAAELGCTGTHFANPHGLHSENHYTTARDLSIIAQEALKSETFRTITSTVAHEVPATNLSEPRDLVTTNDLINPSSRYYYDKASGVKTGYTTPAGRCLISTADNGKLKLLSVICKAQDVPLENGDMEAQSFTETKAMFEYGFEHVAYAKVLTTLNPIAQIPVLMSAGAGEAVLAPDSEITALLPVDYDETLIVQDVQLISQEGVEAPVSKGQILGKVTVSYDGRTLGTSNLVAITDIPRSEIAAHTASTKSFFAENWWKVLLGILVLLIILYIVVVSINRSRRRKRRQQQRERRRQQADVIEFPNGRRYHDRDED